MFVCNNFYCISFKEKVFLLNIKYIIQISTQVIKCIFEAAKGERKSLSIPNKFL